MSLELVKRVFQDDKCIGYYVSDGSKILPVKIEQVYGYAKNKRIANVAIRNNNGSLVLYGINGFRIEDLPVEKVKTSSNKIEVKEIYKSDGIEIGYTLYLNGKTSKVNREVYQNYLNNGKIDKSSITKAKVIDNKSSIDCSDIFNKYKIHDLVNESIRIMRACNNENNKGLIDDIVKAAGNAEKAGKAWTKSREQYENAIVSLRNNILNQIKINTALYIRSTSNMLKSSIEKAADQSIKIRDKESFAKLLKLSKMLDALKNADSFDDYNRQYREINTQFNSIKLEIDSKVKNELKKEADIKKRMALANGAIAKLDKQDELYKEKVKILMEPWCINNMKFLNSSRYLENIFILDNKNNTVASLFNIRFKEVFSGAYKAGFEVTYGDKKYTFRQVLNNLNMLAAFIYVARNAGILDGNTVNIKVDSNGMQRNIQLGVK